MTFVIEYNQSKIIHFQTSVFTKKDNPDWLYIIIIGRQKTFIGYIRPLSYLKRLFLPSRLTILSSMSIFKLG